MIVIGVGILAGVPTVRLVITQSNFVITTIVPVSIMSIRERGGDTFALAKSRSHTTNHTVFYSCAFGGA